MLKKITKAHQLILKLDFHINSQSCQCCDVDYTWL